MSLRPSTNIIKIVVLADSETLVLGQLSEMGKLKIGIFCRLIRDVHTNCFCTSLLRTKFTRHVMHQAHILSSK